MRPVVFVALLAAVSPQDPPPDRESLVKELEDKFLAMGPVTVDVTYESIDSQGVAKAMSTVRVHFRLRDHWAHVVTRNLAEHPPSPETHILFEGPYTMISWSGDGEARWLEEFDYVRSFFQSHYENLTSLAPIFGKPPKHPDRASYWRDLKPKLNLLLTPSGDKNMPAFAKADLALASSSRRASWLEDLESAPAADVSVGKVAVTVASPVTGRSIVIDRGTGFLRSIRMDLKTAGTWGLKVENVERSPLRPPVRIPEKVEYKRAPLDNVPSRLSASLAANLPDLLGRLLGEWGRVGAPERAEELADFLATVAIRHEAMRREVLHRRLAAGMVKTVRDRGGSVSDVEKDLTEAVNALQSSIRENEERLKPDLEKITADFKTEMIKAAEGSGAAAEGLTRAIQKAFEPDRLKRVRTTVRPPEAGPILGQEIAATYARERAPILHTFRSRRELAWELGRRLADLESISFLSTTTPRAAA